MTFEQIYHEHKNLVFNLCLQYVQNTEDAEEITQDVFVKIYESIDTFQHTARLSTWVYRIAINKSLDFLKAKKRKKRFAFFTSLFHENNALKHEQVNFEHPGVTLEHKEKLRHLFTQINGLPANQKTAIILSKIEQKSQGEIAEIMQISAKAAESLIQRAKKSLLAKLNLSEGNHKNNRLI